MNVSETRSRPVRLCVVGLGWYARRAHLPALAALEQQSSKKLKHRRKAGRARKSSAAAASAGGSNGVEKSERTEGSGRLGEVGGCIKETETETEREGDGDGEAGFTIVAVCSTSSQSHAAAEKILGHAVRHHTTLEQVWQDPDINVVDLVLPIPLLPGAVTAALKAGKHVISEKPVAENLKVISSRCDGLINTNLCSVYVS